MFSYVPIANLALQHLGEAYRIVEPDEDSKPARAIKSAWDLTRLFVLAEGLFSFASRTLELTARAAHPEYPLPIGRNAFPLPANMLAFVEITAPASLDENDSYVFEEGPTGMDIVCDEPGPLSVRIIRDGAGAKDPARWTPAFAEAFAFRLAWQISDELAADKARKDRVFNAANAALKLAKRANARTKASRGHATTPWVAARSGGVQRAPGT